MLRSVLGSQGYLVLDFTFCVSFLVETVYSVFGQAEQFRIFFLGSFEVSTHRVHSWVLVLQLVSMDQIPE